MRCSEFFIRRATTTTLLITAIAGFGLLSYLSLPVSNLPEVEYPTIYVSAELPGANPDAMAATVATPLESELSRIPGIEGMTSSSTVGSTNITVHFALNRSIDAAAQDVQAAISRAGGTLPTGMPAPPSYSKVNPTDNPIVWLELHSQTMSYEEFSRYATQIVSKQISMVNGVSQVEVYGPERPAIRVQVDPARLAAYGLDLEQVRVALTSNSASLPTGTLYGATRDYSLEAKSPMTTASEFSDLVVAYRQGMPLRLNQVAMVFNSTSNDKRTFWINGQRSVILAVRKQPGANTVEVADAVKAAVRGLIDTLPPGVVFGRVSDDSRIVRDSIAEVDRTLLLTVLLVVLVIFTFLGTLSSTLIASATIPVSILGSFIVMRLLNYTVDMFSMMAVTLSVGFIVDDAIVMIENIVRHREMGKSKMVAALDGANEVGFTVLSMTVSLVAVFLPILFLNGVLGRLLREFAVTISVSVLLSGVSALTLTPMLCSRFLNTEKKDDHWFHRWSERNYVAFETGYRRSLDCVLKHARAVLVVSLVMTAMTVWLFFIVPKSFMPAVDIGGFSGTMESADDNSFAQMIAYGEQVNRELAKTPWMDSNLSGVFAQNQGWLWVNLKNDPHRPNVKTIIADLQNRLDRIPGLKVYLQPADLVDLGENETRSQYSAALSGPNAEDIYRWAPRLKQTLEGVKELTNISTDLQMSAPRVNVDIRRDLAMSLNVDPEKIANTLYDAYGNRRANTITVASQQYDVVLEVAPEYQRDPASLGSIYVASNTGRLVPLSTITTLNQTVAPLTVNHLGQFPSVTFHFDLRPGVSLGAGTDAARRAAARSGLPASMNFTFRGTAAQFQSSLKGLGLLLVIAVMVIYIVLGVLYESFIHPITILSGLPPAAIGALLTLLAFGQDLNLYSFLGIILLIGIVKKNAIIIVDFALAAEREGGMLPEEAIYKGCLQRFRPIMMTTMAALLGAAPIAWGHGVGGEARRPLGIAVVAGLLLSQSLTLYVTPVVYLYLDRFQRRREHAPKEPELAAAER
ncbi:efflux RND transporter permease subunit [Tunturibacter psychrotolerans]|uniref:Efflux RND transporter permease subunit n=1 Tax=Tunturiibacter psychrotolerans TaxID=3069686 RepID=A0AAU7ZKP0_9BACT